METDYDTTNSFDNLFFDNKNYILNQLRILSDETNFKKYKKKVSLMLHGLPGSGKTALVQAIATHLNRCIIYVPVSKINTDQNYIFNIIYGNKYNNYIIENNEKIIFFDELDAMSLDKIKNMKKINNFTDDEFDMFDQFNGLNNGGDNTSHEININTSDNNKTNKNINKEKEEFDLGFLLSLLDGPFDQTGMVLIATANNVNLIDKSFYRNGRFTSFCMKYMGNYNIANIINYYYDCVLTDGQIGKIRNDKKLSNSLIKNTCVTAFFENKSIDELIDLLNDCTEYEGID
jgi:chaperone BCS1